MDKSEERKKEQGEDVFFLSEDEALDELECDEDKLEEKRKKYISPFDTLDGGFDCFSLPDLKE